MDGNLKELRTHCDRLSDTEFSDINVIHRNKRNKIPKQRKGLRQRSTIEAMIGQSTIIHLSSHLAIFATSVRVGASGADLTSVVQNGLDNAERG